MKSALITLIPAIALIAGIIASILIQDDNINRIVSVSVLCFAGLCLLGLFVLVLVLIARDKRSKSAPYQLCPKCNGMKTLVNQYNHAGTSLPVIQTGTCDICNGKGIIPMHTT